MNEGHWWEGFLNCLPPAEHLDTPLSPSASAAVFPPVVINLESRLAASACGILSDIRLNLALDEALFRNLFSIPSRGTPMCSAGVKCTPWSGYQVSNEGGVAVAKAVRIGNNDQ